MIKFRDYARITDTLQAMKYLLIFLEKYGSELDDTEYVHIKLAYNRLENNLISEYDDLYIHFQSARGCNSKLKSINFLLQLFEIGERGRVKIDG